MFDEGGSGWGRNIMKNIFYILLLFVILISSSLHAADCGFGKTHHSLAVAILKKKGETVYKGISDIERQIVAGSGNAMIIERAVIQSEAGRDSDLDSRSRTVKLDQGCMPDEVLNFSDILKFGLPSIYPAEAGKVGDVQRKRFNVRYEGGEVLITLSHTLDEITEMFGRSVTVFSVLVSGSNYSQDDKERWVGVGQEVWDAQGKNLILKIIEIKRGNLELSYSESTVF